MPFRMIKMEIIEHLINLLQLDTPGNFYAHHWQK